MSGLPRLFYVLFVRSRCRGVIKNRNPWWPTSQRLVGLTTTKPSHLECQLGEAERVRRGKQSTSVVVPRKPHQSQTYPDGEQLHNLYPAPGQPSVGSHQIQLGSLYTALYIPPSFSTISVNIFLHFKFTRKMCLLKLHPLNDHFRHSNHRQQQNHQWHSGRIRITS